MKAYLIKTPKLFTWLYPKRVWAFSNTKDLHLTFDDGPIPEVTPWVLDLLKVYNIKATFFCIGNNVKKHPEIFRRILQEGHTVGNHTHNHLNGWKTKTETYIKNIEKAEKEFELQCVGLKPQSSKIFRPPYGKLTSKQAKIIQQKGYKIIMWSVLSADFDTSISEKKCLQNVLNNSKKGSIVVFHDSLKAKKNLRYALPKVLEQLRAKRTL